jgi:predicted DNA-binding transcriptional regulator YafY
MRRADRLFQIVQFLRGGRLTTAAKLAERLEVSERTIYRDIADLIGSGVPIEGEAGVGYVMRAGYDVPPLMFTADEAAALVVGARLLQAWGGADMARAAEEALVKIDAVLPDAVRARARGAHVHAMTLSDMTPELRSHIDRIDRAAESRTRLSLVYADAERARTTRDVRPLGLWFWGKVWTLIAWCELREDFRMFRLDRIEGMQDSGQFKPERGRDLIAFYRMMEAHRGARANPERNG